MIGGGVSRRLQLFYDVRDFGAVGDGTTDDTAAIQAAIDADPQRPIRLPKGTFRISSTLLVTRSETRLYGAGSGSYHDAAGNASDHDPVSLLKWYGSSGGTIMLAAPDEGASNRRMANVEIIGIGFDGNGDTAAVGLSVRSCMGGVFDAFATRFSDTAFHVGVVAVLGESRDPQYNRFRFRARQLLAGDGSILKCEGDLGGHGGNGAGNNAANTSFNTFVQVWGQHYNDAVVIGDTDHNVFENVAVFRNAAGTGYGLRFLAGDGVTHSAARKNLLINVAAGAGGVLFEGSETNPDETTYNRILQYDKGNGAPDPVRETGAESNTWSLDTTPAWANTYDGGFP